MDYATNLVRIVGELRRFIIFWLGQSLSEIGNRLTGFGLGIWVYQNTHEVAGLSLIVFFTTLPGVVITPFVGALVDRWNRKWTIIFSDLAAATVTLVLIVLIATDNLQIWHTYITAFFTSICGSFQMISKGSALPMMVKKDDLVRANGLVNLSTAIGQLGAPILAAILIAIIQIRGLLIIDLCTYLIGLFPLLIIDIPQPERTIKSRLGFSTIIHEILDGWQNISSQIFLIILLVFMTLYFFLDGMTNVLINPLILSFSSPQDFGTVMSIAGCGMILGSLFMTIWGGSKKAISTLFIFSSFNGIGLIISGFQPSVSIIALGMFITFFTLPLVLGYNSAIWQNRVDSNVQGRVLSFLHTSVGLGVAIGNLSASPLTDKFLEPMLHVDGILANSIGKLIATGPGRGIGFLMIIEGTIMLSISICLYNYFYFRDNNNEQILNDVLKMNDVRTQ